MALSPAGVALGPAGVMPSDFPSSWYWRTKWVIHAIVSILFVTLLWRAGYPEWRTIAIGVLLLANWLRNLVFKHLVIPVRAAQGSPVACTGPSTTAWFVGLASTFLMAGLSGGLR
ncbi:MAG TPA: hypothetical protein VE755_11835, partial [Myxococcales bacterium]|nr:hypothetical protein [Myxococcales bacterium]